MVNDWDDLADLINVYGGKNKVKQIIGAKECIQCMNNMPFKFGHAIECSGDRVLGDYLGVSVDDVISKLGDKLNN